MSASTPTRAERQVETRKRILAAAASVFAGKGFHRATVEEIAAEAEYTTQAIHFNFRDKKDLFVQLIDSHMAEHLRQMRELSREEEPAVRDRQIRDRVSTMVERMSAVGKTSPRDAAGKRLTARDMMMLSLEFLSYAARDHSDLHASLAGRWRAVDASTAELYRSTTKVDGPRSNVTADDVALAHACFVEGLALRLLIDPQLIAPSDALALLTCSCSARWTEARIQTLD